MWTTFGEGAGSCWAHNFKGSRSVEGTPGYAASVKATEERRESLSSRSFQAWGDIRHGVKERTYGSEKEWMGRRIGGRRRGEKGGKPLSEPLMSSQ